MALDVWLGEKGIANDFGTFRAYFQRVWMQHNPPSSWCVSARQRRTNCNIEGYNNFVKQHIRRNPTAWSFLEALQDLAYDASSKFANDIEMERIYSDRSYLTNSLRTNLADLEHGNITVLQFLFKMSETMLSSSF